MKSIFTDCKIVGDNISADVYLRQEPGVNHGNPAFVISRSSLARFSECPHKFLNATEEDSSDSLEFGSLLDTALLSPNAFNDIYVVAPATYPATDGTAKDWSYNAKYCKAWRDEAVSRGKKVIKQTEFDEMKTALTSISKNQLMVDLVGSSLSRKQVMIIGFYEDVATGFRIPVKCLIDVIPRAGTVWERYLVDLKTTASANPYEFEKSIHNYWYDGQAWMFLEMFNAATGEARDSFQWAVVENQPPFEVPDRHPAIYADGEFMELGKAKILRALKGYCQCLKTGIWPSYNPSPRELIGIHSYIADPPKWAAEAFEQGAPEIIYPSEPKPAKLLSPEHCDVPTP